MFVLPDKVSETKRAVLRAYGAEVVVTPTDVEPDDPRSYYSVSDRLAREIPGAFKPNQYSNLNGPRSHYETTGPEIWEASEGGVTHFVAGIGTGGTISGTGRYLKEVSNGAVTVIGADPEGSIYSSPANVHGYDIEGVGEDIYPSAFAQTVPDALEQVTEGEAFLVPRRLPAEEGLRGDRRRRHSHLHAPHVQAGRRGRIARRLRLLTVGEPHAHVVRRTACRSGGRGVLNELLVGTGGDRCAAACHNAPG